jgi:hypothetical protein
MKKKLLTVIIALLLLNAFSVMAQNDVKTYKKNYDKNDKTFVDKAKKEASKLSDKVGDMFIADKPDEDLVKIKGNYYMPLYSVNIYKGADGEEYRSKCREIFTERYPLAKIKSVAIPQEEWATEWVLRGNAIAGNARTLYCYIIAEDSNFGYINAKFIFRKFKEEGSDYVALSDCWPKWERMDYLSAEVYDKLLAK